MADGHSIVTLRTCRTCLAEKAVTEFYFFRVKNSYDPHCKECRKEYLRDQYLKHKDKRMAYDRKRGLGWDRSGREKWALPEPVSHSKYIARTYGIDGEKFQSMLDSQGGGCAICGSSFSRNRNNHNERLCVDHDHATGKVRGLLCFKCNIGIGRFNDDPYLVMEAVEYLLKHEEVSP